MANDTFLSEFEGKSLPFSNEAEQSVIGSVLIDPPSINMVLDRLRAEYFYIPQNRKVFEVFRNRAGEDLVALGHIGKQPPGTAVQGQGLLAATEIQPPLLRAINAHQQLQQGAFSGPVGADERHQLAAVNVHIHILQDRFTADGNTEILYMQAAAVAAAAVAAVVAAITAAAAAEQSTGCPA